MSKNFIADNRFVVPYNPWLLQKYDCHINVEVCSTIQSVKHLYKYVYKGPDCISFRVQLVQPESENNEVTRYINARWVCAQEAMWRIYRGATSYENLLTVDCRRYQTFKSAAEARGLLENDNSLRACMAEAATNKMPSALRTLFGSILVFRNSVDTRKLWYVFFNDMVEDYASSSDTSPAYLSNRLFRELGQMLHQHGKRLKDYDLPAIVGILDDNLHVSDLMEEEVSILVFEKDMMNVDKLNEDQSKAYDAIMGVVRRKESRVFFVDGPGGTGKTFLYRAILSTVRRSGGIAIATATYGVAATMLPGGRTAHSRFKLPFTPASTSTCDIAKNDKLADLLRQATVIMWDEATMVHKYYVEAFNTTMRDITGNKKPFGGKIVIMGGDFRQVASVEICRGSSPEEEYACSGHTSYSEFLIRVGDENEPSAAYDMIKMPDDMVIPWTGEDSVSQPIDATFPDLADNSEDQDYLLNRALITPLNEHVDKLNDQVVSMFPGQEHTYYSFDSVEDDFQNLYLQEQLNGMAPGSLPPHELKLKLGAPIMLLRNVSA
ncbi:uncharacterized protein LOC113350698 [Papaver somniferum]|uniref:uncharacterized protein LOC113350698 n=1 Tax=Papaver somniferum TaxID=3469 RepID=UPI000E6FFB30|nr:uncharacterized protein LOC113350698 [Papaver somniferum]